MTNDVLTDTFKNSLKPIDVLFKEAKSATVTNIGGAKVIGFPKPTPKEKDRRDIGWSKMKDKAVKKYQTKVQRAKKRIVGGRPAPKRKKRTKLPSIKSLKVRADKLFSLFIRNRDKNTCVLCNSKTNIQCGHLIKRGKMATRYNEKNCNALCSSCNYKDNFEHDHYVLWFIKKYGTEEYSQLVMMEQVLVKANRQFYEEIINKYANPNL